MARLSIEEMVAEGLREVGVLVLVFATLDRLVAGNITVVWTLGAVLVSVLVFVAGLILERVRPNA